MLTLVRSINTPLVHISGSIRLSSFLTKQLKRLPGHKAVACVQVLEFFHRGLNDNTGLVGHCGGDSIVHLGRKFLVSGRDDGGALPIDIKLGFLGGGIAVEGERRISNKLLAARIVLSKASL